MLSNLHVCLRKPGFLKGSTEKTAMLQRCFFDDAKILDLINIVALLGITVIMHVLPV